jgi:hypothetical protein
LASALVHIALPSRRDSLCIRGCSVNLLRESDL